MAKNIGHILMACAGLVLCPPAVVRAGELKVASVFTDHAVLQRDRDREPEGQVVEQIHGGQKPASSG